MNLIDVKNKKRVKAQIKRYNPVKDEFNRVVHNYSFNWVKEKSNEVFCLKNTITNEIIGLMSLSDIKPELRLQINLIESSIPNRGKNKTIKNIPHCLISYAAKQSFALGYDGFVSLYPKSELIQYYISEYGFERIGTQLAIYGRTSFELIQKYLK